jgi:hypothetical protein
MGTTTSSQSQLRHLRLVASSSTLTLLFAHEVRSSIASLGAASARLRAIAKKVPEFGEELSSLSQQLGATQGQLARLVDMTGIVGAFRSDRKAVELNLKSALERAASCFRLVTEIYGIEIDLKQVSPTLQIGPIIEGADIESRLQLTANV